MADTNDLTAWILAEDLRDPVGRRARKPLMTAEDNIRDLQPRPVVFVVDIGDQVRIDRDREPKPLRVPHQRPDEPRIRQDSEVRAGRLAAERIHGVFDGVHRAEIRESHSAAVRPDEDDAHGRRTVDHAVIGHAPCAYVCPDHVSDGIIPGDSA